MNPGRKKYLSILVIAVAVGGSGCNEGKTAGLQRSAPEPLPFVHLNFRNGVYFVPGCSRYGTIHPNVGAKLDTAQEAELAGYRRANDCSANFYEDRIQLEKKTIGEVRRTAATEALRIQLSLNREVGSIRGSQSGLETKQEELEEQLDEKIDKR